VKSTVRLLLTTMLLASASGIAAATSSIAGTWQGKLGDQPAITLAVKDSGGKLSGTIVFYLLRNNGLGLKSGPKSAGPPTEIMNAKFDGRTLTFEVSHRLAHPPRTLNDTVPVKFRIDLTGKDEGQLQRLNYGTGGNTVRMRREK